MQYPLTKSGSWFRLYVLLFSATAVFAHNAAADDAVIYRETFNVPNPNSGAATAAELGWVGFRNGGSFNNPCTGAFPGETCLQAFQPGCTTGLASVGNDPVFAHEGNAFWSPQVIGVSIYTEEFPIDVSLLRKSRISFEIKHSQTGTANRLALRIGDTWYMSEGFATATTANACQTVNFVDLANAVFGTIQEDTTCTTPPCGPFKPTVFDTTLPEVGEVNAFGLFVDGTSASHRFDNYTISFDLSTFDSVGECISTLIATSCSGLTGRDRASCNREQIASCHAHFDVPSAFAR
jgi:hypothetical protein